MSTYILIIASVIGVGIMPGLVFGWLFRTPIFHKKSLMAKTGSWWILFSASTTSIFVGLAFLLFLLEFGLLQQLLGGAIMGVALDPNYLRKNVSKGMLIGLRDSATRALLTSEPDPGSDALYREFLDLINERIYPVFNRPWRKDFHIELQHTLCRSGALEYVDVAQSTEWDYVSFSRDAVDDTGTFYLLLDSIGNMTSSELFSDDDISIIIGNQLIKPKMHVSLKGNQIEYSATYLYRIRNGDHAKMVVHRKVPRRETDALRAWMNVPTKGFRLTYKHPANFVPSILIFGFIKEQIPTPETRTDSTIVWEGDAWLMPKHGFILSWKDTARVGD